MRPLHFVFAATAIIITCCTSLVTILKRAFRSECIDGEGAGLSGSTLRPAMLSLLVAAALASVMTASCLVKLLSKKARALFGAVCSKWQPLYFVVVSVQKIVVRVIANPYAFGSMSKRNVTCHLDADNANQFYAAIFLWDSVILMTAISTICADVDVEVTPGLRRCAQSLLALCLCVDAVGSYVWGNEMAGLATFSISRFEFLLDNQITSCITSQAVLALHFMFVGLRSRLGRGWFYASLRFELEQFGRESLPRMSLCQLSPSLDDAHNNSSSSFTQATFETDLSIGLQSKAAGRPSSSILSWARERLLQFQQRHVSKCRVFLIPCTAVHEHIGNGEDVFALARPFFEFKCLRPLQRIAEAHPKRYFSFGFFFLGVPSFLLYSLLERRMREIIIIALNASIFIAILAFISGRRYNLDRVAAKQVALSFRFAIYCVLVSQWIALDARRAYLVLNEGQTGNYGTTFLDVAAVAVLAICFCVCLLLDCSPNLPVTVQFFVTVSVHNLVRQQMSYHSRLRQAGWWLVFGIRGFNELRRVYSGEDADCFWDLGAYQVCDASQRLSIFSSLILLMTQSVLSRILVPGISNFVNASVRRLLRGHITSFAACLSHTPQILLFVQSSTNDGVLRRLVP